MPAVRVSDLARIAVDDVDIEAKKIFISCKGDEESYILCSDFRFVRRNRGWTPVRAACQVSDRAQVRGSGTCGNRRIFSW